MIFRIDDKPCRAVAERNAVVGEVADDHGSGEKIEGIFAVVGREVGGELDGVRCRRPFDVAGQTVDEVAVGFAEGFEHGGGGAGADDACGDALHAGFAAESSCDARSAGQESFDVPQYDGLRGKLDV